MRDHELAEKLLKGHFTAGAELIALVLKNLSEEVRTRTPDAVRNSRHPVTVTRRALTRLATLRSEAAASWISHLPLTYPENQGTFKEDTGCSAWLDFLLCHGDGGVNIFWCEREISRRATSPLW